MPLSRVIARAFPVSIMVLGAGAAFGQDFPTRPIRMVTSEPTGGADFAARLIAQGLSGSLGQQAVVENRGGGVIAGEVVSKAQADGHTLLVYGNTFWLLPLTRSNVPYDPLQDFAPITLATRAPTILVVHTTVAANSVRELIALAKARPGVLNYPSGAAGGVSHLSGELFKAMAGVDIVRIPFKGTNPALNALLGGQVQLMFATAVAVTPHIKSGRLRALAVTSAAPSALVPGLPTLAASGLPGYEAVAMFGVFAPAKTPATLISRLNQEIVQVLNRAQVKERVFNAGSEAVGSSPEQFSAAMKSEIAKMGKVIKDAGIRDQ